MAGTQQPHDNRKRRRISFSPLGFLIFLLVVLSLIGFLGYQAGYLDPYIQTEQEFPAIPTITLSQDAIPENTPAITSTSEQVLVPQPQIPTLPPSEDGTLPGLIIFSMMEAGYSHLFAYHPEILPITRLTYGEWDDRHPAINPDGTLLAFTSNRSGVWDLYLLDMTTGETKQITNDSAYNGNPAWSSDGLWLAYEKYQDNNLDIFIKPVIDSISEVRITSHPAQDMEPSWQPGSTTIAFTSTRDGSKDVFLVDTNQSSSEQNYTLNHTSNHSHPFWSPDGRMLAWTAPAHGYTSMYFQEAGRDASQAHTGINANLIAWDPTGDYLVSIQDTPHSNYLSILDSRDFHYILLPIQLSGRVDDISWGLNQLPNSLPAPIMQAAQAEPRSPWNDKLVPSAGALYGRQNIIDLPGIKAPHAALSALAVEPFFALKDRANLELGWDVLSDLENLFVPISQPLPPGRANDWLYTGRAFSLNPVLIDYDYMAVVREDYGPETFWRVYLKPLDQSGNQGMPLTQFPWNFQARYSGSPSSYEGGGEQFSEIPAGYWVDFTTFASEYGWERQSALSNWKSYYQGARFNVFVITSGLSWEDAMLQVWPPEVFEVQKP